MTLGNLGVQIRLRDPAFGTETIVKEQIRLRGIGFGWKDLHHAWSKGRVDFSAEHLRDYFIKNILPEEKNRGVPEVPAVNLPSRAVRCQLGTRSADVDDLEKFRADEKKEIIDGGVKLRDQLEDDGIVDRYEKSKGLGQKSMRI